MTTIMLNVLSDLIVAAILAIVGLIWKHREVVREKLDDWSYEAFCLLFNPGKKGRNAKASISVEVVGMFKSRYDPYTGERFTVRSDDVHVPPMPDSDEHRQLIFRLPPD